MTEYTKPTCKGSIALNSGCGKCERCLDEMKRLKIESTKSKRPTKYIRDGVYVYQCTDIDPLLDRLDAYERIIPDPYATWCGERIVTGNMKPFPTLEEFKTWWESQSGAIGYSEWLEQIRNYFSQFRYETKVFPKVGDMVEGEDGRNRTYRGKFKYIGLDTGEGINTNIRPISTPTRGDILTAIKSARSQQGKGLISIDSKTIDALIIELEGKE